MESDRTFVDATRTHVAALVRKNGTLHAGNDFAGKSTQTMSSRRCQHVCCEIPAIPTSCTARSMLKMSSSSVIQRTNFRTVRDMKPHTLRNDFKFIAVSPSKVSETCSCADHRKNQDIMNTTSRCNEPITALHIVCACTMLPRCAECVKSLPHQIVHRLERRTGRTQHDSR